MKIPSCGDQAIGGITLFGWLLKPLSGLEHISVIRMHLKHIVDLAQQLHSVVILWNLQTDFLQMFLDAELSAVIQLLPELAAVVCGDAQLFIDHDSGDGLLLTGTLDPGFLLVQQETQFL